MTDTRVRKPLLASRFSPAAVLLAAVLGLLPACSSDGRTSSGTGGSPGVDGAGGSGGLASEVGSAPSEPSCVSAEGLLCSDALGEFAFATLAIAVTDYCSEVTGTCPARGPTPTGASTATLRQPASGTLCLSGTVSPGGFALLAVAFSRWNTPRNKILATLDVARAGITQAAVTIDTPPLQTMSVAAHSVASLDCPASPLDCFSASYTLSANIRTPGPVILPLGSLPASAPLHDILFSVDGAGDYDFCIHDFQFLDAEGNVVKPAAND